MRHALALLAALVSAGPVLAAETPITIKDPAAFRAQMTEMGYAPDAADPAKDGASVVIVLHLRDETLAAVLAGCKAGRDCTYVALVGSFSDVDAPAAWVTKVNTDYDLIKVWLRDDGKVAYASGFPAEGLARAAFRNWVDGVVRSTNELAGEAIKAGYGPKP